MKQPRWWKQTKSWLIRHKKPLTVTAVVLMVISVAGQMVYPFGRAVPFASVAGQSVAFKSRPEITLTTQSRFAEAKVIFERDGKEIVQPLANIGASVDADTMAGHATDYPWIFRILPLSIIWYQPHLDRYSLEFDETRLRKVSGDYAKELSAEAVNAGIKIDNGELAVTSAKNGRKVTVDEIVEAVKTTRFNWDETKVAISGENIEPKVSDASVADVKQRADRVLAQKLTIRVDNGQVFNPERAEVASWLELTTDKTGAITLGVNDKVLAAYTSDVANKTIDKPSPTIVKTLDGKETSRKNGTSGRGIDTGELAGKLSQLLEQPGSGAEEFTIARQEIKPPIKYERDYTSSQAGLTAYTRDISRDGKVQISVRQLDGPGWLASGDGDKSVASASTYKPLLMVRVFEDVKRRDLKWEDKIGGETLTDCFERMIVHSANECAERLIKRYGVHELTKYLHDQGFSSGTGFTFKEVTQTTANDLTKFMTWLESGNKIQKRYRDMMLEKMSRQIYRKGIPAGTEAPVFNKVGFLWDYLHDMAIVRHPEGTYVLTVMTKGKSWEEIANITRQVEKILYG